jgi:hypothetical protein
VTTHVCASGHFIIRESNDQTGPEIYGTIFAVAPSRKDRNKIVDGIRSDDYAHVVREDPKHPGLLFAGAEHCV